MALAEVGSDEQAMPGETAETAKKHLVGTDEATIDDKGRLLVGKKKRERLGVGFVISLGDTGCLVAYPAETWEQMVTEILSNSSINQGRQQYARLVVGSAEDELNFDRQGRIVIPIKLREAAKLRGKVVLVGLLDRMEIWAKEEYESFHADPDGYGRERREAIERAYMKMTGRDSI